MKDEGVRMKDVGFRMKDVGVRMKACRFVSVNGVWFSVKFFLLSPFSFLLSPQPISYEAQ